MYGSILHPDNLKKVSIYKSWFLRLKKLNTKILSSPLRSCVFDRCGTVLSVVFIAGGGAMME